MGITRIRITNYRGIEALDAEVPPNGAIVSGDNGQGKTTVLRAVQAALAAQDIGPDAIRNGADKAEILVDMSNVSVRRAITRKASQLTVTNADGFKANAPQTFLRELLGASNLDPIALFACKPKERRAKILEAMPVQVTHEQLRQWVPALQDSYDTSGHGLEVIERLYKQAYDKRTALNASAKAAREISDAANNAARRAFEQATSCASGDSPDVESAQLAARNARERLSVLVAQDAENKRVEKSTASTRARILELRAESKGRLRECEEVPREVVDEIAQRCEDWSRKVHELEVQLFAAKNELNQARIDREAMVAAQGRTVAARKSAKALESQADELAKALEHASVAPVAEAELQDAENEAARATEEASATARAFRAWEESRQAKEHAILCAGESDVISAEAKRLDGIVKALADAPSQLLAQCDGIPGLTIAGDDVLLDGVSLDSLCGAEKIRFAVQIAKRANAKAKILVVDELERLSAKNLAVFVREATADGWQLIGTRVSDGEVTIEAIGGSDANT